MHCDDTANALQVRCILTWDFSAFEVGHFLYTSQTFWKWEASVDEVQIKGTLVEV